MHRAFAPVMTKREYCNPRRTIAGWISPRTFALAGARGNPKCWKIRNPRAPAAAAASAGTDSVRECVSERARVCCSAPSRLDAPCWGVPEGFEVILPFPPPFSLSPPPVACPAAFAARCVSCSARRSAFVICLGCFFSALGEPSSLGTLPLGRDALLGPPEGAVRAVESGLGAAIWVETMQSFAG